ncbi:MAG: twin-arginine translocase TatA/TatE family subunit [Microbacterium sp.]
MFQNLTGWHAVIILAIVLLIFGAAKLPALARSVGQSVRILKDEASEVGQAEKTQADATPVALAATVPATTTLAAVPQAPVAQHQSS